jgi:hypothetical protein
MAANDQRVAGGRHAASRHGLACHGARAWSHHVVGRDSRGTSG